MFAWDSHKGFFMKPNYSRIRSIINQSDFKLNTEATFQLQLFSHFRTNWYHFRSLPNLCWWPLSYKFTVILALRCCCDSYKGVIKRIIFKASPCFSLTVLRGVPLGTVSLHIGHGLQRANGRTSSHKTAVYSFPATVLAVPLSFLEVQKTGYFYKHGGGSRTSKAMSSLLSVMQNSELSAFPTQVEDEQHGV